MINFDADNKIFHLVTKNSSYVIGVNENGKLEHLYYGGKISIDNKQCFYDFSSFEYPTFGGGDFRIPAISIENNDGRIVNQLEYIGYNILKFKPALMDLPSFDCNIENVDTLEIILRDTIMGYEVSIYYSVFDDEDAITRYSIIRNTTLNSIKVNTAMSLSLDFMLDNYDLITLHGCWARERHINRQKIVEGVMSIESVRGSSGHQHNPFAALVSSDTNDDFGNAYGFALVYSGNYKASTEVDNYARTRFMIGINPFNFSYYLEPGEIFTTPEAVMVFSEKGLNGMSQCFHDMCRNHLGKSSDKNIKHPLLINSWEAMYFDMNEEKINTFIKGCNGLGIDTFVLDDGWFGHRDSDNSSLGDWFVDKRKFPNGLHGIIDTCKNNGLSFGIWFEPEMISRDSELYKKHPDWCIHINGKEPTEIRQQLVLDMSRNEIVNCVFEQMSAILDEYDIKYIKWDMNRYMTDNGTYSLPSHKQGEHAHRYILGVYKLMQKLVDKYPHILFEGCASGGGRLDFGMLYYMPQFWTSDDTDAIERLKIQYGTSLVYPPAAMTAHVSASPNHQTGRCTPFKTRSDVAQAFNFGYELDVNCLTKDEREQIKEQTELHKKIEPMIYDGDFYRLENPFKKDICAWELVSKDKTSAFVVFAAQMISPNQLARQIRLKGLEPDALYKVEPLGITMHGDTLMKVGIFVSDEYKDFTTATFLLEKQ